ncbi:MAG: hypothetical protein ABIK09_08445 [Pseudomonadota bacterium]
MPMEWIGKVFGKKGLPPMKDVKNGIFRLDAKKKKYSRHLQQLENKVSRIMKQAKDARVQGGSVTEHLYELQLVQAAQSEVKRDHERVVKELVLLKKLEFSLDRIKESRDTSSTTNLLNLINNPKVQDMLISAEIDADSYEATLNEMFAASMADNQEREDESTQNSSLINFTAALDEYINLETSGATMEELGEQDRKIRDTTTEKERF